jgi:4-amino-4-deoxy-L-arabinose transferase-like glycosyltransferase
MPAATVRLMEAPRHDHPLHATTPAKLAWLVALVLLWALYGMTGRDAWQRDEVATLGETLGWLETGRTPLAAPLYSWLAGLGAWLLQGVYPWQDGARFASSLFTLAAMLFTALAARRLYGPGFGSVAALLLMGTFGLLLRAHALLPETALLAGYALLLHGLATGRDSAGAAWAIAAGGLMLLLTRGLPDLAAAVLIAALALLLPGHATRAYRRALAMSGVLLALALAAWLAHLNAGGLLADWWSIQTGRLADAKGPGGLFSTLVWFAWPAWPLARWALWHEHRRLGRDNPLHLPLVAALVALLVSHVGGYTRDGLVMPAVVPLILMAAYGVATLKRGAAQAFYWFGVTSFAFFALAFWIYFAALEWGWPTAVARHLTRLTPGYTHAVPSAAVLLAAGVSLLWAVAVPLFPRAQVRPALVWATGMTLTWLLLVTLFRPWIETSYAWRPIAQAVDARLPAGACVEIEADGPARVMLHYHLAGSLPRPGQTCAWRLVLGRAEAAPGATPVWQGVRPRDRQQVYRLYRLDGDEHP